MSDWYVAGITGFFLIAMFLLGWLSCEFYGFWKEVKEQMSELGDALTGISTQLDKAKGEIVTKIADLEAALANAGQIPADVQAAVDALKAQAQALDDVVPDVPA